jgi:hypothetical protein
VPAAATRARPGFTPERVVPLNVHVGSESHDKAKSGYSPMPMKSE